MREKANTILPQQSQGTYLINLVRSTVGFEQDLVQQLTLDHPEAFHFKVFGKYDVLEIMKLEDLHEAIRANSDPRVLEMISFPSFCKEPGAKDFWNAVSGSISPCLSLLKLQESVFRHWGLQGIYKICDYLNASTGNPHALLGMGYYEILHWLPSNNFEEIFALLKTLRGVSIADVFPSFAKAHRQKGLFVDTTTVPLVSYQHVILQNQWSRLQGNVTPFVKVKCAPGHDQYVAKRWPKACHDLLGADDLLYVWSKPKKLGVFISELMDFRKTGATTYSVFDTTTRLFSENPLKARKGDDDRPPVVEKPTVVLFEQLRDLAADEKVNPFIISEIINIVSLLNSHMTDRLVKLSYSDIAFCRLQLNGLLKEYRRRIAQDNLPEAARIEDRLLQFVDCLYMYMAQQFPAIELTDFSGTTSHQRFSFSISRLIKAISVIPEQLFLTIKRSKPPDKLNKKAGARSPDRSLAQSLKDYGLSWKGFLFLDMAEGYQLLTQGEIIVVPYKDIFLPLDWITLSHEISHAYYTRIFFRRLEKDFVNLWPSWAEARMEHYQTQYASSLDESHSELFAHWFDYSHFFSSDFDLYLWSIWGTWLKIPLIYEQKKHYWLRSLFVRTCHSWSNVGKQIAAILRAKYDAARELLELTKVFQEEYNYVAAFLKGRFSDQFASISLKRKEKEEILEQMTFFYPLCKLFWVDYVNKDIIDAVNQSYPALQKNIDSILAGKIVKNRIHNPFLVLRELNRSFYDNEKDAVLDHSAVVALVYSFWEASRHFRARLQ